ncbi:MULTISPECIES: PspC domain-containing protein [unclassified Aeromicrobium]|uniref:PspC domain-containing protein n=1 Tax=unclassified Aeromicrobium TaxID=2633570 RepID=UPI00288A7DA5|nr:MULTISPECIES: PspC domain-containing protein [unclassified Aeromicrobium]
MTTQPPPTDQAPDPGASPHAPGPRRGFRAFSEVRRSSDDRMLAGVCDGVARRFDIDPVVVRVLTVVLCFVGLAGVILYVAGWLLLPADDEPRSHVGEWFGLDTSEAQVRDTGLVVAAVLAVLGVLGDGGWGWGGDGLFWAALVIGGPVALVVWLVRRGGRRGGQDAHGVDTGSDPSGSTGPTVADPATSWSSTPTDTVVLDTAGGEHPTAGLPPTPPSEPRRSIQPPPPREPREPYSWIPTLLALSSIAIALAVVRLVADPTWPTYVAVALAVVGLGLVLCTFVRGGLPLVLIGLLLLPVLALGTLVPTLRGGELDVAPQSAAQVRDSYSFGFGQFELDLTDVSDPDALLGRTIEIETGMGQTVVVVPDGVPVVVDASVRAGDLVVLGERDSGVDRRLRASATGPALTIDVDHSLGQVEVRRP